MTLLLLWFFGVGSNEADLKAHVAFLASDLLEGRETATRGQYLAAQYIGSQLAQYGVAPTFEKDRPYYQEFEVEVSELDKSKTSIRFSGGGSSEVISGPDIRVSLRMAGDPCQAQMVYVGYGRLDKENNINDFARVDLKNKWIIVAKNNAVYDTQGSRRWQIMRHMAGSGAKGAIIIDFDNDGNQDPFPPRSAKLPNTGSSPRFKFPLLVLDPKHSEAVFGRTYKKFKKTLDEAAENTVSFELKRTADYSVSIKEGMEPTGNVVARIPGTDETLSQEYVVVSAHYDHLGIKNGVVFNGADDNASGSAVLLRLAKHFQQNPQKRTLILLWATGEEVGLLGSNYFLSHLGFKTSQLVANINIDMVARNASHEIGYIPAQNDDVSSLSDWLAHVNQTLDQPFTFRTDMDRYHHRSDHYNFVKVGVPAIFLFSDTHEDYHKPSDDWQKLDYDKLSRVTLLVQNLTEKTLNETQRPTFSKRNKNDG